MKVAIIGVKGLPAKGGAERVVEAIIKRITPQDIEPTLYCDAYFTPADYSIDGVNLLRIPTIPGKHFRTLSLVLFSSIHAVLFGSYELIHLHNIEVSFVLPLLRIKYKVFSTAHGFAYSRSKWSLFAKKIMKTMDYLFVICSNIASSVSVKDARDLEKRFGKEVLYIPNGVGTEFSPDYKKADEILKMHELQPSRYFIFMAGRMERTKGAHLAIEAVNRLNNDVPLLVVGNDSQSGYAEVNKDSYGQSLRAMAGSKVFFQAFIGDPSTLFGLMKYSICLIFPSLVEAMSMVLLEAASLGVPVICSDIEENKEVMGREGIYFKSGDIESLHEMMQWVLRHPEDVKLNAKKIQVNVKSRYSWNNIANQYFRVYKETICN